MTFFAFKLSNLSVRMFARSITEALSSKLLLVSIVDLLLVNGKDEDAGREGPASATEMANG